MKFLSGSKLVAAAAIFSAAAQSASVKRANTSNYRFLNNDTQPYLIESMPEVNFDFGEMYGGSIPIDETNPTRTLYFIFKPAINQEFKNVDEVTIFLNGGPGCSSLAGFLQENGPISWQPGASHPTRNIFSWSNITNMIWVDQPVGTGFSTGIPDIMNEVQLAQEFIGFFKNWQQTFSIKNFNIYVTGESYAGRYVPYISAAMLDANDPEYYDLKGALVYDPVIGSFQYTQESAVTYPFLAENNGVLDLSAAQLAKYKKLDASCGYSALRKKYYKFPPPGNQPIHGPASGNCNEFNKAYGALLKINKCFNIYHITDECPLPVDPLGFSGPSNGTIYFDRSDVKQAIHAPAAVNWKLCGESRTGVFLPTDPPGPENEGDGSPDPIQNVLPQVIDATQRVLVSNGDLDMIIITNGTLLSIQNMTWGGKLGFQKKPNTPITVTGADLGLGPAYNQKGSQGIQHYERGLMWAETFYSGHMQPQYAPESSLIHLQWLLGRRQSL